MKLCTACILTVNSGASCPAEITSEEVWAAVKPEKKRLSSECAVSVFSHPVWLWRRQRRRRPPVCRRTALVYFGKLTPGTKTSELSFFSLFSFNLLDDIQDQFRWRMPSNIWTSCYSYQTQYWNEYIAGYRRHMSGRWRHTGRRSREHQLYIIEKGLGRVHCPEGRHRRLMSSSCTDHQHGPSAYSAYAP